MKEIIHQGYNLIIGQTVSENDYLINTYGHTGYIWLHLKSFPSCHVVILDENPPSGVVTFAAVTCRDCTKYRNIRSLKVSYTPYHNVEKTDTPGKVSFKSNRKVKDIKL